MKFGIRPFRCAGPALLLLVAAEPASAQVAVFDTTNYTQNLLQAARALEQVNNQVRSLQNEATMIENMARNLQRIDFPQLSAMNQALKKIGGLMGQGQAIGFRAGDVEAKFDALFPKGTSPQSGLQRAQDARARLRAAMDSFQHSMRVQSEVVSNISADTDLLEALATKSQASTGALQAQQAANQLLALSAKQQLQLQDLLAAEFRSQSIERATRSQSEAEARAATARFLGTGKAPQRQR